MNDFKSDIPEEFRRLDELERKATLAPWRASSYSSVVGCAIMAQPDPKKNSVLIGGTHGPMPSVEVEANAAFIVEAKAQARPLLDKLSESITRQETASKNAEFYANKTVKLEAQIVEYKLEVDRLRAEVCKMRDNASKALDSMSVFYERVSPHLSTGERNSVYAQITRVEEIFSYENPALPNKEII